MSQSSLAVWSLCNWTTAHQHTIANEQGDSLLLVCEVCFLTREIRKLAPRVVDVETRWHVKHFLRGVYGLIRQRLQQEFEESSDDHLRTWEQQDASSKGSPRGGGEEASRRSWAEFEIARGPFDFFLSYVFYGLRVDSRCSVLMTNAIPFETNKRTMSHSKIAS